MEYQANAPQHRPDMVQVAVVGQLMCQHMVLDLFIPGGIGGQIDRRTQQTKNTGRRHRLRHIYGKQAACDSEFPAAAAQMQAQMDVAGDDDRGHHHHSGKPDPPEDLGKIQLHATADHILGRHLRRGGIIALAGGFIFRNDLPVGIIVVLLIAFIPDRGVDLSDRLCNVHALGNGSGTEFAGKQLHRDQKPHQHHRPEGVLEPEADPAPEQEPDRQHCGDQDRGGKDPFIHHGVVPPLPVG